MCTQPKPLRIRKDASMSRNKILEYYENKRRFLDDTVEMIKHVPLNTPIQFIYKRYIKTSAYTVVGMINLINKESFQIKLIAAEKQEYPWPKPDEIRRKATPNQFHICFKDIKSWGACRKEDYPIYATFEAIYPEMLKQLKGEL